LTHTGKKSCQAEQTTAASPSDPLEPNQPPPEATLDANTTNEPDDELEINDLKFFVRFVKENLKEDLEKQRQFQSGEATKAAFDDLHNLFRPLLGSYVAGSSNDTLRAYQVVGVGGGGKEELEPSEYLDPEKRNIEKNTLKEPFILYLLYLDFDGNHFSAIHETVMIQDYDGMLPIRSLRVFPVNFLSPKERKTLDDRGGRFLEYALGQADDRGLHKYCAGVSLNVIRGSKDQACPLMSPGLAA